MWNSKLKNHLNNLKLKLMKNQLSIKTLILMFLLLGLLSALTSCESRSGKRLEEVKKQQVVYKAKVVATGNILPVISNQTPNFYSTGDTVWIWNSNNIIIENLSFEQQHLTNTSMITQVVINESKKLNTSF